MGTCWKYTFLCPNPDLLNQKLQGVSPENCVLTSPPGDTGVRLKFENSGLNYVASWVSLHFIPQALEIHGRFVSRVME